MVFQLSCRYSPILPWQQANNPHYDLSPKERICDHSQCHERSSSFTSMIQCVISPRWRFLRGKQTSTTAKIKDEDQSSVSSDSEDEGVESFCHSKGGLQDWKQGAGKSKSWKRGPTLKRCGYQKSVPFFQDMNPS